MSSILPVRPSNEHLKKQPVSCSPRTAAVTIPLCAVSGTTCQDTTPLLSAGMDGRIREWSPATGEEVRGVQAHARKWLAVAGADRRIRVWELPRDVAT